MRPLQVHHPGVLGQRHGAQGTRRGCCAPTVDQRTGGLADVAGATAQQQVATPAVFIHIVEAGLASGQVDARAIAQLQVVFGAQAARRQVDQRTGGLADVAGATAQQQVATPAVFIHIVEAGLASGQVDARAIAQLQVVFGAQAQLAAG